MSLCGICAKLDIGDLISPERTNIRRFWHADTLLYLEDASSSCNLCALIFSEFVRNGYLNEITDSGNALRVSITSLQYYRQLRDPLESIYRIQLHTRTESGKAIKVNVGIYPDEGSKIFPFPLKSLDTKYLLDDEVTIPRDIIANKPTRPADQQFDLMKRWIQRCDQHHSNCVSPPARLPTRVIDVGIEGQGPVLKVTNTDEKVKYTTLSHCWGPNPIITTTKANLREHCQRLPQLPKTFQDAIQTTKALGIRYVWIDSLCIVQDDPEDWERESALMGEVYSSSYLTIAASASRNSNEGCFLPRENSSQHVRIRCTLPDVKVGHVFLRPLEKGFPELSWSFLQSRGWVVQERLLSHRTIHFDSDQILWECRFRRSTENGMSFPCDHTDGYLDWDGRRAESQRPRNVTEVVQQGWLRNWYDMVENYTGRKLTQRDDKLPALSGMASKVAKEHGQKYVAGLWEEHLNSGMLWHSDDGTFLTRPEKWRAPSWSWASMEGRAKMVGVSAIREGERMMLQDIKIELELFGSDPHGRLESAMLNFTTRIKKINQRIDPKSEGYSAASFWNDDADDHIWDGEESIGVVTYDEEFCEKSKKQELWALQLTESKFQWTDGMLTKCHCLVVEYLEEKDAFARVGLGKIGVRSDDYREGWFHNAEMKRIELI